VCRRLPDAERAAWLAQLLLELSDLVLDGCGRLHGERVDPLLIFSIAM